MIAHRLSTIALADQIVVLEDGGDRGARARTSELLERLAAVPADRRAGGQPDQVRPAQGAAEREVAGL